MKIAVIWIALKSIWSIIRLFFGKDSTKQEIKKLKTELREKRYAIIEELNRLSGLSNFKRGECDRLYELIAERSELREKLDATLAS